MFRNHKKSLSGDPPLASVLAITLWSFATPKKSLTNTETTKIEEILCKIIYSGLLSPAFQILLLHQEMKSFSREQIISIKVMLLGSEDWKLCFNAFPSSVNENMRLILTYLQEIHFSSGLLIHFRKKDAFKKQLR